MLEKTNDFFTKKYLFGENIINFKSGTKKIWGTDIINPEDYCVFLNNFQFTDLDLFNYITKNIKDKLIIDKLIDYVIQYDKIEFKVEEIILQGNHDEIYDYCYKIKDLNDVEKTILFCIFLRIDIDNINYPPPSNGGIRHLVQILMLLSYTFNLNDYKSQKISIVNKNIYQVIKEIGFPKNAYNFNTDDFHNMYIKWLKTNNFYS